MIETGRRSALIGLVVVAVSFALYWLANRTYDAGRGDFFYLADAFLHGRTWLTVVLGPQDVITIADRTYVPFGPFPAIALMPLVALLGPVAADNIGALINAALAAGSVGLAWVLLHRIGVNRTINRVWLVTLFGFSTQMLWVTTRGGVWHTGQLFATVLTLACLVELWGGKRAFAVGLLAGAAFLSRAPLALAIPFYALLLARFSPMDGIERISWRPWLRLALGVLPAVAFFFAYNQLRFGSALESGYALATLPEFLERQRAVGLFSLAHVPMNLDYLFLHLPRVISNPPFLLPDGLGLSLFITSPGLFYAVRADFRGRSERLLLSAAIAALIPSLLYYGGGWWQYGYRYFLDSMPFVIALCGLAAAQRGEIGLGWKLLISMGVVVMAAGVAFAHAL